MMLSSVVRSLSRAGEQYMYEEHTPLNRSMSMPGVIEGLVDRVYTVGCFDLFHNGHIRLLQRMRSLGRQVGWSLLQYRVVSLAGLRA